MKKNSAFSLIELSIVILIIGILIAGVTQATRVVAQSRLNSAKTQTQSSPVHSIHGLSMWLEPTMDSSITSATNGLNPEHGDKVSSWNDINVQTISSKVNPSQGTDALRPIYVTDGIGGLPSLKFNNAEFLSSLTASAGNVPLVSGDDSFTLVAVWNATQQLADKVIMEQNSGSVVTGGRAAIITAAAGTHGFNGESNDVHTCGFTARKSYVTVITVTDAGVVSTYSNSLTTPSGGCAGTINATTESVGNFGFYVGIKGPNSLEKFEGLIAELMVFDRPLKTSEISEVMKYLSKKYSIKLN